MEEIWKDVIGYDGLYQVSDLGNVKSLSRLVWNGKAYYRIPERILKNNIDSKGYHFITLCKNGTYIQKRIHQLMAESFFGYRYDERKLLINHKNFIRTDNDLSNIEIVTNRENTNQKHIPHTSKYTGVSWDKLKNKWFSCIRFNGKMIYLGRFDNEEDASMYYENAVIAINSGNEIVVKRCTFTSGHKGVCFVKRSNKWAAYIDVSGKRTHLGYFINETDAAKAYQDKSKAYQDKSKELSCIHA